MAKVEKETMVGKTVHINLEGIHSGTEEQKKMVDFHAMVNA